MAVVRRLRVGPSVVRRDRRRWRAAAVPTHLDRDWDSDVHLDERCSHARSFLLKSRVVRFGHSVPGVHISVHTHGNTFLQGRSSHVNDGEILKQRFPSAHKNQAMVMMMKVTVVHTCSELSRELPGLPIHFLKHLSVILCNTNTMSIYLR